MNTSPLPPRIVHLFVFDAMADWEAANAVAAINNPQFQCDPCRYRVITASPTLAPITTLRGVRIQPDVALSTVTPQSSAMLILPGGGTWESGAHAEALKSAAQFIAAGVPVAAICEATQALARAGLLDGLRHNSIAREYLISSGYRGTAFYCGVPAATDRNRLAATGLAPVDFAREIFKMLNLDSPASIRAWQAMFKPCNASKFCTVANH